MPVSPTQHQRVEIADRLKPTATMLVERLTASERDRMVELERVVDTGLYTFVEVGLALKEIRDSKLYRTKHPTFGDYCRQRWRFTRTYGHRLIVAAEVAGDLSPIGNKLLTCEAQARELGPLSAERRREVWLKVTAPGHPPPTAKRIREAILEQRVPRKPVALKVKVLARRLCAMFADACYMVAEPEQLVFLEEALAEDDNGPRQGTEAPYRAPPPALNPRQECPRRGPPAHGADPIPSPRSPRIRERRRRNGIGAGGGKIRVRGTPGVATRSARPADCGTYSPRRPGGRIPSGVSADGRA